jgi:uncharacterized UPF0160 family protein
VSRAFAVQLTIQTHFHQALSKLKNGDTKYQAAEPYFCQISGLDNWLKPSFRKRNRSNIERYKFLEESSIQIKEFSRKLEEKERTCNGRNNKISHLRGTLKEKEIELDDRDYTIKMLKNEAYK